MEAKTGSRTLNNFRKFNQRETTGADKLINMIIDKNYGEIEKIITTNPKLINTIPFGLPDGSEGANSPLAIAICTGDLEMIEFLLQRGAFIIKYNDKYQPLTCPSEQDPAFIESLNTLLRRYLIKPAFDELTGEQQQLFIKTLDPAYFQVNSGISVPGAYVIVISKEDSTRINTLLSSSWAAASSEEKLAFAKKVYDDTRDLTKYMKPYDIRPISYLRQIPLSTHKWIDEPAAAEAKAAYEEARARYPLSNMNKRLLDPNYRPPPSVFGSVPWGSAGGRRGKTRTGKGSKGRKGGKRGKKVTRRRK